MEQNLHKYLWFVITGLILRIQFTSAATGTGTVQQETCKEFCPLNFQMICAFDGSAFVEYSNLCFFEIAKCQARNQANREPSRVPMAFCELDNEIHPQPGDDAQPKMEFMNTLDTLQVKEDCEVMCTAMYQPVCATDGVKYVTYSNTCLLAVAQCKARNDGTAVPLSVSSDLCKTEE